MNTGSFDPLDEIADAVAGTGAWLHVDGAFGLWAAARPRFRHLVAGAERADSWATDAHKWLNVPYDCGIAFCAPPARTGLRCPSHASYLEHADAIRRATRWTGTRVLAPGARLPDLRGDQGAGAEGIAAMVERCCDHATRFAELLGAEPGVEILNDVVLNQVLVRFGDDDEVTKATIAAVQEDGTCWLSGTVWQGRAAMRISVSNWRTTDDDVERSAAAILAAAASVAGLV